MVARINYETYSGLLHGILVPKDVYCLDGSCVDELPKEDLLWEVMYRGHVLLHEDVYPVVPIALTQQERLAYACKRMETIDKMLDFQEIEDQKSEDLQKSVKEVQNKAYHELATLLAATMLANLYSKGQINDNDKLTVKQDENVLTYDPVDITLGLYSACLGAKTLPHDNPMLEYVKGFLDSTLEDGWESTIS